jgi:hypothetical protein
MPEPTDHWQKLARLARQAPQPLGEPAPLGFATRVAARWVAGGSPAPSAWDVLEFFSLRGLAVAGVLMLAVGLASSDLATAEWAQQYTVADATFDPLFQE